MHSDNLLRPADKNLLINKLQATLEEIARGVDESAIEAHVIGSLKGDDSYDDDVKEKDGVMNNAILPAEMEENGEKLEGVVEHIENEIQIEVPQENTEIIEKVVEEVFVEVAKSNENKADDDDISSEAIRYNSKGESIENPKAQAVKAVESKDEKIEVEAPLPAEAMQNSINDEKSSSNEHGQRLWDVHGNSIEGSSSDEAKPAEIKIEKPSEKINHVLNQKVGEMRDNQLNMRHMDSDEEGFNDDDDIPVITIPMGQILKTYNQMLNRAAGVYSEETEEYSDEIAEQPNHLNDPRLQNILRRISNERKRAKLEQLDPNVRRKPAALRVLDENDEYSDSAEDL